MINVKDQVAAALLTVTDHVSDVYPHEFASYPVIQYTEEDNSVYEHTDGKEQSSRVVYRIDIWHGISTSAAAMAVDEAVSKLGLLRTECQDVPDPSGLKHKVMRYKGIIENKTQRVFYEDWR